MSKVVKNAVPVWLSAPLKILRIRLAQRGTEKSKNMEQRLAIASHENEKAIKSGIYNHSIDTSNFDTAFAQLCSLIKSHLRVEN